MARTKIVKVFDNDLFQFLQRRGHTNWRVRINRNGLGVAYFIDSDRLQADCADFRRAKRSITTLEELAEALVR